MSSPRCILHPSCRPLVASFAKRRVLVALDFDGVLAAIAPRPAAARVEATTRRLARRVAALYPSVVISGRARAELVPRLEDVPFARLIGNFGYQAGGRSTDPDARALTRKWVGRLAVACGADRGVVIEDKGYSLAVHYRHARHREATRAHILDVVATLEGARWLQGTLAISVLPEEGRDKGTALHAARRALRCDCAIYVGDDGTDEDAFASDGPERLIAVRVGRAARSNAPYRLHHQSDINAFLEMLLALRVRTPARQGPRLKAQTGKLARPKAQGPRPK